ncbi:MAG TPA: ATPase, T2SS/T4P/T4SS family [Wenzhouxiangellaceae bacterium]|nr:ATPase, T2SS/T4P/T4SS family [Wenzhouxiangellaceae bacterium]
MSTYRTDPRIDLVLQRLPRSLFIASPDLRDLISGRSIPSREIVRQILERIPRIKSQQTVLMIGSGAGYLPAVVSHLARQVLLIERHKAIADIARRNLDKAGIRNVEIIIGDGQEGLPARMPFQTILVVCRLSHITGLLEQLDVHGNLVCFEGIDGQTHELVLYRRHNDEYLRRSLGPVDFARETGEILIDLGYIEQKALEAARGEARRLGQPVLQVVRRALNVEDADLYRSLAHQHGLRFVHAEEAMADLDPRLFRIFSKTFLDNQRLIPVCVKRDQLVVATDNPDAQTYDIEHMHPYSGVVKLLVTPTDFRRIWSNIDITSRGIELLHQDVRAVGEQDHLKDLLEETDAKLSHHLVAIYEAILLDAVSARASDIHIERYGARIRVRIRTDGELRDLDHYKLGLRDHAGLINVIKVQAEINIAERRLPQGGRSQMRVGNATYDLRVQIQPSLYGEHAVIRILSQSGRVLGLDDLGMSMQVAANYRRLLDNPSGLVLVVGPTGSGKSTTLYAGLQLLADDGKRKVITVEDPIEYSIDNIQQTRVRPEIGFNFADAMRSFVRQDPDVILVGEIRDTETALEAMRASQTGHVVLSTLHSNDAVDALQRLYDLGVDPNSIAGELLAVIAQRLAKRICPDCREEVTPDPVIVKELFPENPPAGFRCFAGAGCKNCGDRGTLGRVGIVEYLHVDDEIRNAISARPPVGELRWRALDSGLITMRDSALDHVIEGTIPLSELPRLLPQERMAPEKRGGMAGR